MVCSGDSGMRWGCVEWAWDYGICARNGRLVCGQGEPLTILSESEEQVTILKVVFVHHMVNVVCVHQ